MYAIIEDSGTQIKVSEGDVIRVATRDVPANSSTLTFDKVLMVGDVEGKIDQPTIGTPRIDGATVTADVLAQEKTDKVIVIKFKRRKGYKRKYGHRQDYLKVRITSIQA